MKKLLGLILVICLMAGVVPASMADVEPENDPEQLSVSDVFVITAPEKSVVFDGTGKVLTVTESDYELSPEDVYCRYSPEENLYEGMPVLPGDYQATASYVEPAFTDAVYSYTITPAITGLTVNDKEYDGTTDATVTGKAELSGIVSNFPVALGGSMDGAAFEDANVGADKKVTLKGFNLEAYIAIRSASSRVIR